MATVTLTPAAQARACFADTFGSASHGVAMAPGRVNLIGEHTDYNDGFVLPLALECGVAVAFARRDDGVLRAHAPAFSETRETTLGALDALPSRKDGHWLTYVAGMMWALRKAGMAGGVRARRRRGAYVRARRVRAARRGSADAGPRASVNGR